MSDLSEELKWQAIKWQRYASEDRARVDRMSDIVFQAKEQLGSANSYAVARDYCDQLRVAEAKS